MKRLGKIEKVRLRDIWNHEAHDFTQWLAKEENITSLLDEISISAENIKTEDNAGQFNVDITADESETGKKIIIENQLERTDHKHLGQLLTYASSFDACIIVWVVADFREEHKKAIEWFNENMNEAISFFLVKTEVWQIGDSNPAVKFNVIVEPNNWAKITRNSGTTERAITESKLTKLKFWEGLIDYSEEFKSQLRITQKAKPQHWYVIAIGSSNAHLSATINTRDNFIGIEIYFPKDKSQFYKIYNYRIEFEAILNGFEISWEPLPDKQASRIRVVFNCNPNDESKWESYYKWMISTGELMQKAYRKIISKK